MKELTIDAAVESIEAVTDFITAELEPAGCSVKALTQISIAIDELFGNIAKYAYDNKAGKVTVQCAVEPKPPTAVITFIDSGKPFDPLKLSEPDIHAPAQERREGGLGVYLVKKTMDLVEYSCRDGHNILTIKKKLT